MINRIRYTQCPLCNSKDIAKVFSAGDYTTSEEEFDIYQCATCSLRFTQDVPDEASISRYYQSENYISHSEKAGGTVNRLYRLVRKRTLKDKKNLIEKYTGNRTGKLLDIGSGTGAFAAEMQTGSWKVTGLEPDAGARKIAEEVNGIRLLPTEDFFHLPPDSFDAITLWHVLEHIHNIRGYVKQLKALLKENGKLFIAVPNYTSLDAEKYKQHWAGYDVPRHLFHFAPKSMRLLLQQEGLVLEDIKPMWFDSFYVSLLSSKYKKGRTAWATAFWTGLRSNLQAINDNERCSSLIYIVSK